MTMRMTLVALCALITLSCGDPGSGGADARVTLLPSPGAFGMAFSQQGKLAVSKYIDGKAAIYVANADASAARRVSFGVWDNAPRWSPDGKWIAFNRDAGGQADIFLVPADSGAERPIATTIATETGNAWSPDGSTFLFRRTATHGDEIWEYRLADGSTARLFEADGSAFGIPTPDGKSVVYTLGKGGKFTLWLWNRETKAHRQLTKDGFEVLPILSGEAIHGNRLIYRSFRTGTDDLWLLDLASGETKQLTQDVGDDRLPKWAPDGSRFVFLSNRGGQTDLWVMTVGENDVQRVTNDTFEEFDVVWTPDGTSLLVSVPQHHQHLFSVPVAGGVPTALTSGDWNTFEVAFSRDRSEVAFTTNRGGDLDVWAMTATGANQRLVAGGPGDDTNPSWSADKSQVVFRSSRSGTSDLWIVPASGGTPRHLTDWPSQEFSPKWSPDSKSIAFLSDRESAGGSNLWLIPATGGAAKRLTTTGGLVEFQWTPDGAQLLFAARSGGGAGTGFFGIPVGGGVPRPIVPPVILSGDLSPSGRSLAVSKCIAGYCRIEIRTPDGTLVRDISPAGDVYEFEAKFTANDSLIAVNFQDLKEPVGASHIDIRSREGVVMRRLSSPVPGAQFNLRNFVAGDSTLLVRQEPNGTILQRVPVPPAAKP
jgi:Tol biopolymer transport system component